MNSVSWFIYIAQVSESIGKIFITFGVIGVVATLTMWAVPRFSNWVEDDNCVVRPFRCGTFALAVAALVFGNLMPKQNTMYAIAASEVGEQVVKGEIATDATKALHQWIKKQIEPEKKG